MLTRRILGDVAPRAAAFRSVAQRPPCLAAVLVGHDLSSENYVNMKGRRCQEAGVHLRLVRLPEISTTSEVVDAVSHLSTDPEVDGILLRHPVPRHVDARAAFEAIHPDKDVDGVTMHSFAALAFGLPGIHLMHARRHHAPSPRIRSRTFRPVRGGDRS